MDERVNGRMDRRMDQPMDGPMDGRTDGSYLQKFKLLMTETVPTVIQNKLESKSLSTGKSSLFSCDRK